MVFHDTLANVAEGLWLFLLLVAGLVVLLGYIRRQPSDPDDPDEVLARRWFAEHPGEDPRD
jgi:hypothetical protein